MKFLIQILIITVLIGYTNTPEPVNMNEESEKTLNDTDFSNVYLEQLELTYPKYEHKITDYLKIITQLEDEREVIHYLDNAYSEYSMEPDSLKSVIERYVNSSSDLFKKSINLNLESVVPIIKPKEFIEYDYNSEGEQLKNPNLLWKQYNDKLVIVYAMDSKTNITYFDKSKFDTLNMGIESLHNISIDNLNNILPEITKYEQDGWFYIIAGGDYEASTILLTDLWTKDNFPVNGDIVVAIPNRDILMITGSNDKEGIKKVKAKLNERFNEGSYPISSSLFKFNGVKFEVLK
jgi:uncharacterized protein YtpQ (UPF0354 family)